MVRATDPDVQDGSLLGPAWAAREARARDQGPTFLEWAEDFFSRRQVRGHSLYGQRSALHRQLASWHSLPLRSITEAEVLRLVRGLEGQGMDARAALQVAATVIGDAIKQGAYPPGPNPARRVRARPPEPKAHYLSDEEVEALYAAASPSMALMIRLGVDCGLRRGEVLALKVSDLTPKGIRIVRTVTRTEQGKHAVGPPKSAMSRREIATAADLLADLRAHAARHPSSQGWIFPGRDPNAPDGCLRAGSFNQQWCATRKAAGLHESPAVRMHDLRHTFASRLIEEGISLVVVSRALGHSSTAITDRVYGHLGERSDEALLAAVARSRSRSAVRGGLRLLPPAEGA